MAARAPSGLSSTSLFQNRNTRYPSLSRKRVRLASASDEGSCCPPSISTISLAAWQTKSAMNLPIGTCRRNRQPSVCRDRSICQSRFSASVMSRRRFRARSPAPALGAFFTMDRSSASPPPWPSPIEGEGVTGCPPVARLVALGGALGKLTLQIGYELFGTGQCAVGNRAHLRASSGTVPPARSYRTRRQPPTGCRSGLLEQRRRMTAIARPHLVPLLARTAVIGATLSPEQVP